MAWEFSILYFLQSLHNPVLDSVMTVVTTFGDHGLFWIILGLILFSIKRTRRIGLAVLCSLLLCLLIGNIFLKNIVARPRPSWIDETIPLLITNPKDYSFPSGHSLASFAASFSIFLHNRRWGLLAICLASAIAFSRLYLFVHFPTDVLTGVVLGILIAVFVWKMVAKCESCDILRK